MRIVGLTGSIGCGKSHVSSVLCSLGAAVIDGDAISHELTSPSGPALPRLREPFGDGVFQRDGALDRKKLGALVFSDAQARERLNAVMQPMILREIHRLIAEYRESGTPVVFLDMPLLFEEGLDRLCDTVWCVYLPPDIQAERIMARDGMSREAALARMASQLSSAEKKARSQVIIDTCGTLNETAAKIPPLYAEEVRLSMSEGKG